MAINGKLTNVLGVKMPFWIVNQLETRSNKGSLSDRSDNENLKYLSNKTAWVRLASSVDVSGSQDFSYFQKIDPSLNQPSDLAKNYVLFGGTSKFLKQQSYELRWGLHNVNNQAGGAYGMLGESEVHNYGYRPMPGITRVHIDTQGRLGSVRQAIIDIKCWDKAQLDIIDALYFKLGYTMFLEWGHTYYYPNEEPDTARESLDPNKVLSSEFMSLDPFAENVSKEELTRRISENSRKSYGNYDGMLGIVTNFNFSYNAEGGYDCVVRMMGLGVLGDSIKINNPSKLIDLLTDEVLLLRQTLEDANPGYINPSADEDAAAKEKARKEAEALEPNNIKDVIEYLDEPDEFISYDSFSESTPDKWNSIIQNTQGFDTLVFIKRINRYFSLKDQYKDDTAIKLNMDRLSTIVEQLPGSEGHEHSGGYRMLFEENWRPNNSLTQAINETAVDYAKSAGVLGALNIYLGFIPTVALARLFSGDPVFGKDFELAKVAENIKSNEKYKTSTITIFNFYEGARPIKALIQDGDRFVNKYIDWSNYNRANEKFRYTAYLTRNLYAEAQNPRVKPNDEFKQIDLAKFYQALQNYIKETPIEDFDVNVEPVPQEAFQRGNYGLNFTFRFDLTFNFEAEVQVREEAAGTAVNPVYEKQTVIYTLPVEIVTNDTSVIEDIIISGETANLIKQPGVAAKKRAEEAAKKAEEERVFSEQQKDQQKALLTQINESLGVQSNLEISLRTIQVRALNSAFYEKGATNIDLSIGRKVYALDMTKRINTQDTRYKRTIAETVFSNGVYEDMIADLIDKKIEDSVTNYFSSEKDRLKINAKYGFATTLMGSDSTKDDLFKGLEGKDVDYLSVLKAYVIPYEYSSEIVAGIKTNHPVYIPFGLLLMLLNHSCTLYDESTDNKGSTKIKKPLVYIDYNDKLNFFQTCPQQMSTNPWIVLTRVECNKEEYKKLFNPEVLQGDKIRGLSNKEKEKQTGETPLFDPENMDLLSYQLPAIKTGKNYTGNIMNILLNVDYLVEVIKHNSFKDGTNGVYLKPFLEEVITDINKYLGNFNAFRLNYSDKANTFQIVDDQYVDTDIDVPVQSKPIQDPKYRTQLPLVGRSSIAKSLELKTELGSKLANLIAISANSAKDQSQNSVNGDSVGFINDNYVDRIVPKRMGSGGNSTNLNGEIAASQQFNRSIEDFYASIQPSKDDVSQATNFLIDKISNVKNETAATRATAMIPLGVNFTTDGIAGMSMYQTFTVSDNLLPYTYYSKKSNGFIDGQTTFVGFVVVGLTHVIENNVWSTSVRSNMISVKDKYVFKGTIATPKKNEPIKPSLPARPESTPNADRLRAIVSNLNETYSNRITFNKIVDPWNANLGYIDKLALSGDITEALAVNTGLIFAHALSKFSDLKIVIGGGNDIFHQGMQSPHTRGKGLDFTVFPEKYQVRWVSGTNKPGMQKADTGDPNYGTHVSFNDVLQKYVKDLTQVYQLLDEYLNPSYYATDGHYHITVTS